MQNDPPINPYRAPGAEADVAASSGALPPIRPALPWNPIDAVTFGWEAFRKEPACAAVVFVGMLIGNIPNLIGGAVQMVLQLRYSERTDIIVMAVLVRLGFLALGWPLMVWMNLGIRRYLLNLSRARPHGFNDLFSGGPQLVSGLGAAVVLVALMLAALLVFVAPAFLLDIDSPAFVLALLGGGSLVGIAATIVGLGVSQYEPLIVDGRCRALESLSTSWRLTRGHKLMLFVLALLGIAVAMAAAVLGLLALCVGVIVTVPIATTLLALAQVYVYLKLTGEEPAGAAR